MVSVQFRSLRAFRHSRRKTPLFRLVLVVPLLWALTSTWVQAQGTTGVFFDSQPGNPIWPDTRFSQSDVTVNFFDSAHSAVTVLASPWIFSFGAALGQPFAAGVYEGTSSGGPPFLDDNSLTPLPHMAAYTNVGVGCLEIGRFQVYEFATNADGTVAAFAADFELHCLNSTPAMFGAVRYHSTRSAMVPFDGNYPSFPLHLDANIGGYVTGTGIDCGAGRNDCDETYSAGDVVTLQVTASAGYTFLGWAGDCYGDESATVLMTRRRFCAPMFDAGFATGHANPSEFGDAALLLQGSLQVLEMPAPDYVKLAYVTGPANSPLRASVFPINGNSSSAVQFQTIGPAYATRILRFAAPSLVPGTYDTTEGNGASLSVQGACGPAGRFTVYEYTRDPIQSNVLTFAADFETSCGDSIIDGSIRYHSSRTTLLPFDGAYPMRKLTIDPVAFGTVTATGIDCGAGHLDCTESSTAPLTMRLQANPLPGYRFIAWTGGCEGPSTTIVVVDWLRRCSAVFGASIPGLVPEDDRLKDNAFVLESQPGDPIGAGRHRAVLDGTLTNFPFDRGYTMIRVDEPDLNEWWLYLSAGGAGELKPGTYEGARVASLGSTTSPGIYLANSSSRCPASAVGRFVIHEISFASSSSNLVTSLAVDFAQECAPGDPSIIGSIRFHSRRSRLTPFSPTEFTLSPGPVQPDLNRDGWPDLVWRHATTGQNAVWFMNGLTAVTTALLEPTAAARVADLHWEIRALGDLNGDGDPDFIWQNRSTGQLAVWFMLKGSLMATNYIYTAAGETTESDLNWKIVAAVDLDADGQVDLLWRHRITGETRVSHMRGYTEWDRVSVALVAETAWDIVGAGDFNRDGLPDLVWRRSDSGQLALWYMNDSVVRTTAWMFPDRLSDLGWHVVGVADMNADGSPDLVWQNVATGDLGVWFMDGPTFNGGQLLSPSRVSDLDWRVVGVK